MFRPLALGNVLGMTKTIWVACEGGLFRVTHVPSVGSWKSWNHRSFGGHMRGSGGDLGSFMFRPMAVRNSFGTVTIAVAVATVVTIAVVVSVAGVVALVEQQL